MNRNLARVFARTPGSQIEKLRLEARRLVRESRALRAQSQEVIRRSQALNGRIDGRRDKSR
jgi:hypothetical protein